MPAEPSYRITCAMCKESVSGPFYNGLLVAQASPGWAAWLDAGCETRALCPEHAKPVIEAVEALRAAFGSDDYKLLRYFMLSTFRHCAEQQ